MDIQLENLNLIPRLLYELEEIKKSLLLSSSKRWLNIKETADYLGYSIDGIRKLKDTELILDVHYFKKTGKLLFDKQAIDDWMMEEKIL